MSEFNRFDICEAFAVLEWDYNVGGWLQERPSNVRRGQARGFIGEATSIQLHRMQFRARPDLSFDTLTENGRRIYIDNVRKWSLPEPDTDGDEYIFAADAYCTVCAERLKHDLVCPGDPDDETTYDSCAYPKGPFSDQESDGPQHCAGCGLFLRNPLTSDGVRYVAETVTEDMEEGRRDSVALRVWAPFYRAQGYDIPDGSELQSQDDDLGYTRADAEREPLALPVFYRIGDADDYHNSDDVAGLAVDLATDGVRPPVERHGQYGLGADGFRGQNYISAYHGEDAETPVADLSDDELRELNAELARELAEQGRE